MIAATCCLFFLASCSELEARRTIQKGDKLYQDGRYSEAIKLYEDALSAHELDTAHHNLAVAAFVAFQPGIDTAANKRYAEQASEHFQAYLKHHPKDDEIIELLTTVWLDSDQTDTALAYWEKVRGEHPDDPRALAKLSSIERMAGRYDEALAYDYARVELASDPKDKVLALVQIGQLQYSRISKMSVVDEERLAIADSGLQALQMALALQPDNANIHSLMATIYQFRSLAQETGWARSLDMASQRYHHMQRKALADKAAAASHSAAPAGADKAGQPDLPTDKAQAPAAPHADESKE